MKYEINTGKGSRNSLNRKKREKDIYILEYLHILVSLFSICLPSHASLFLALETKFLDLFKF